MNLGMILEMPKTDTGKLLRRTLLAELETTDA
jgi:hypothetical protein